ncbi:hypothetical protein V3J41_003631 [Salmonella enterica]|nr:hypothetical protein [Salmonella enterica]EAV1936630.1 hypothetical protein [Salmonella enterica]EIK7651521.1 hypothetical protein [Salmonella enterica]EKH8225449.1 hypothetical protein [Salmonella enterica]
MKALKNIMLWIAVAYSVRVYQLRRRMSLWLSGLLLGALASQPAHAAGGDLADIVKNALGFFTEIKQPLLDAAPVVGIGLIILALLLMKWKKNNPQIKPWEIAVTFIVGLGLLTVSQLISSGQKQFGFSPTSI